MSKPTLTLFAGFSKSTDPAIMAAAEKLGRLIGEAGYDLVCGGGKDCVLGAALKAAMDAGAKITVATVRKQSHEAQHDGISQILVDTEQERFGVLTSHGNPVAYIALPGGPGTLREIAQTMESAVYDDAPPVILVAIGSYFDGVFDAYAQAAANGLMSPEKLNLLKRWTPDQSIESVLCKKT